MRTLYLGVVDIPYQPTQGRTDTTGLPSTGDVAEILEEEYGIMAKFVETNESKIAEHLADSVAGAIETMAMGGPTIENPLLEGLSGIEEDFRRYLESQEAERVGIPGTPTKAALDGVNHRLKHPYAKANPRRPSFVDTGQYQLAFKTWTD